MLEGLKARNSAPEKLRQCLKSLVWVLSLASVAFISYSVFSISGGFQYRPVCDSCAAAAANPPTASVAPTNVSHIMFGIGGSAATWPHRQSYSELWWRPGVTRGHVWLDTSPVAPWPESCPPFKISANTSHYGKRADAARIARIAAEAYAAAPEGTRWFVMGDDDTVFFVENLVAVLGRYDHEEMWYIGASSESVEQDVMHSYSMAFGGGGFAVSRPAAAALAGAIDGCLRRYAEFYGSDQRVHACFAEIGVPLTRQPGFHQVASLWCANYVLAELVRRLEPDDRFLPKDVRDRRIRHQRNQILSPILRVLMLWKYRICLKSNQIVNLIILKLWDRHIHFSLNQMLILKILVLITLVRILMSPRSLP